MEDVKRLWRDLCHMWGGKYLREWKEKKEATVWRSWSQSQSTVGGSLLRGFSFFWIFSIEICRADLVWKVHFKFTLNAAQMRKARDSLEELLLKLTKAEVAVHSCQLLPVSVMSKEQQRWQIQRKIQSSMSHWFPCECMYEGIKLADSSPLLRGDGMIQRASYGFHFLSECGNWQAWRYNSGEMSSLIKVTRTRLLRDIQACQRHLIHRWINSDLKLQPAAVARQMSSGKKLKRLQPTQQPTTRLIS